jgi:hypothetical protein
MINHGFRRLALAHSLLPAEPGPESPTLAQSDLAATGDERQVLSDPPDGQLGSGTTEPVRR